MTRGAVVPHAPVLLPGIAGRRAAETRPWRDGAGDVVSRLARPRILVSPHALRSGIYRGVEGSLRDLGAPGRVRGEPDESLIEQLDAGWGRGMIDDPLDYAAVSASLLADFVPDAVVGLAEISGPHGAPAEAVLRDAEDLAAAVQSAEEFSLCVTGHTCASLSPGAPLGYDAAAVALEERVIAGAREDAGVLAAAASDLAAAGSCSAAVWSLVGRVFAGAALQIVTYGSPYGVGYVVAEIDGEVPE